MTPQITKNIVISLVQKDVGLTPQDKARLIQMFNQTNEFDKLMAGSKGAGIAFLISKFLKLSPQAQVLLSMAGFGIGSYFKSKASDKFKLVQYNDKIKAYELK